MNTFYQRSRTALSCVTTTLALATIVQAQSFVYTSDADFDAGLIVNLNHDAPNNDQLQLGASAMGSSVLSVACGGTGTVVRIDTITGQIVGEYRTTPQVPSGDEEYDADPSRATVDLEGNTWVSNRLEQGLGGESFGTLVKIGTVVGGTRVNADGTPNPDGEYLAPPYEYNTCVDRDGDGLIRTSRGLGDVLDWPNVTDGDGGTDARVEDSLDECILIFQRTQPVRLRHLSVDANNNVWAGGYNGAPSSFDLLNGETGAILDNLDVENGAGCGGFTGLVDAAGVLWSTSELEGELLRYDGNDATCVTVRNNVRGVAVAANGDIWTAGGKRIARVSPNGDTVQIILLPTASQLHGIAISSDNGDMWVASSATDEVYRLDPAGNVIVQIPMTLGPDSGDSPRGIAIDRQGFVWVANQNSDDVMRIDPATNAVDLRVALRVGARPYNPSDMTGEALLKTLDYRGHWDAVADAGDGGDPWDTVSWSASTPGDSSVLVFVRSAEAVANLASQAWVLTSNGAFTGQSGRFLQTRVELERATSGASPILFDMTLTQSGAPDDDDICTVYNRRNPGSLLVYPEFDNVTGSQTILTLTHNGTSEIDVEFVYIDGDSCEEFNRVERMTPNDTLTLLTSFHNPNHQRGFAYVFARDTVSGAPIVSNTLSGNALVISGGFEPGSGEGPGKTAAEYQINAIAFLGIGANGLTDLDSDGHRDLDGLEYAQAPDEILIPRFYGQTATAAFDTSLILLSLSGGAQFDTTLDFLIYNDNEEIFSSEYSFHCWEKTSLLDVSGIFAQNYLSMYTDQDPDELLGADSIETGWMRIDGGVATSSTTTINDPAFFAVLIDRIGNRGAADLPFESCTQPGGVLLPRSNSGE